MFAVVFNPGGEPIEARRFGAGAHVEVLGRTSQTAFVWSNTPTSEANGEGCVLQRLGDRFWLVGRIRLDARRDLEARLGDRLGDRADAIPDGLLCLHAYAAWGERFVDFLTGDFSFTIWDDAQRCLIGVRDQLGVRTLFHARHGNSFFLSDSLDWIVEWSGVGRDLDDHWIADFLTIGFSREFQRTVYRDIRRVVPAHLVKVNAAGPTFRRYWQLDIAEPLRFRDRRTYTERFRELVSQSIADRLPTTGRLGICMSGGLDSTTLAACAVEVTKDASRIVAECHHYEKIMHIGEGHFATLAARKIGIELRVRSVDDLVHDPHWQSRAFRLPEPSQTSLNMHNIRRINGEMAQQAHIWFEGEGPDNALTLDRNAYLSWLYRNRHWGRLGGALFQYAQVKGVAGWAKTFQRHTSRAPVVARAPAVPSWLDREFVARLEVAERTRTLDAESDTSHGWHPRAVASFRGPIWQSYLDEFNFQEPLAPIVRRHPFLDLRVLEFMLSVPPIPWGWKKQLVREAMKDRLPPEVLARQKTPLALYPDVVMVRKQGLPELLGKSRLAPYVDVARLPALDAPEAELYAATAVHALDHWLSLERA